MIYVSLLKNVRIQQFIRLSHFYGMPSESDIPIHTFSSNFRKVSRFVSSLDLSVSEYHSLPTIFAILQQLMIDRLSKKFAQPYRYGATATPPPICSERKYVTSKPEPETRVCPFPNPKTRVYKRNGFTKGTRVWKL